MLETLVSGDFHRKNNCVLVHSGGMPSHGTKAFVKFFNQNFHNVPIYCVGDCNPSGVNIMKAYFHSPTRGYQFSVPAKWLGMRPSQLDIGILTMGDVLSKRDKSLINGLMKDKWTTSPIKIELEMMKVIGMKFEAEAIVRELGGLAHFLEKQIAKIECKEEGWKEVAL